MKKLGIGIGICLAVVMQSQAAVMVDFDSSDITDAADVKKYSDQALNTSTPILANSGDYAGQSIYGEFSENTGTASVMQFDDGGARIRWETGGTDGDNATALFLFKKDEFLNGLDTATVSMDAANDTVSANWSYINGGVGVASRLSALEMRFVIQDSTGWHISAATAYGTDTFSLEATTLSYFDYENTTIGAAESASFNDIQFVGYYVDATRGSVISGVNAGLQEFSVTAIPEPATIGLLGFGAFMTLIVRRWKRS